MSNLNKNNTSVAENSQAVLKKKIINAMTVNADVLQECDEQLIEMLNDCIQNSVANGMYSTSENNKRKIEGSFKYVQRYNGFAKNYEGFVFQRNDMGHRQKLPVNIKIVVLGKVVKSNSLFNKNGVCLYVNKCIIDHFVELLKNEGVKVVSISGLPENGKFISSSAFRRRYSEIDIVFNYEIEY